MSAQHTLLYAAITGGGCSLAVAAMTAMSVHASACPNYEWLCGCVRVALGNVMGLSFPVLLFVGFVRLTSDACHIRRLLLPTVCIVAQTDDSQRCMRGSRC